MQKSISASISFDLSKTAYEIGVRLVGSEMCIRDRVKTVSTYRTRLMEKMNLSSNSDLTYYALKNKLID